MERWKSKWKRKFIHINGFIYEGNWKDYFQDGEGTETWPDGSIYKGNYLNGKKKEKDFLNGMMGLFMKENLILIKLMV